MNSNSKPGVGKTTAEIRKQLGELSLRHVGLDSHRVQMSSTRGVILMLLV